ncbi:hypothetical protein LIER_33772 [Lithospermum erythrorhizon]|uniref:Endonuclease/exonuclease/phosphatase domain-containing protein n=1 Tax=Lithospermum erythrorhizon TaxID=34254 RepID=A0AAV3S1D0_LITER
METKLWKQEWESITYKLKMPNSFLVDARGRKGGLPYFGHEIKHRRLSWELLKFLSNSSNLPTIVSGDFNEVLDVEHSSFRRQRPLWQVNNFRKAVLDCDLMDIGFSGYPFTWSNNFFSPYFVRARLDRSLISKNCGTKQELARKKKRFRFEDGWFLYEESKAVVERAWNSVKHDDPGTQGLLRILQRLRETNDIYWHQRSRLEWRVKGDRNTGYFHAVAVQRHRANFITALQDENGALQTNLDTVHKLAVDFYKDLFSSQSDNLGNSLVFDHLKTLDSSKASILGTGFTMEDVKRSLFSMQKGKAPGPDGLPAQFF